MSVFLPFRISFRTGLPNASWVERRSRTSSHIWNPSPMSLPYSKSASCCVSLAPPTIEPPWAAAEYSTAVFRSIISRYSSGLTTSRSSKSRSICCPSASNLTDLASISTSLTAHGASTSLSSTISNALANIASPASIASGTPNS